jgi:hypothetical protein
MYYPWVWLTGALRQLRDEREGDGWQGTLVHLSEGRVLAAWFGGTYEGLEDTAIYTAFRFARGNWSEPLVAAKVCRAIEGQLLHGHIITPTALRPSDGHKGLRVSFQTSPTQEPEVDLGDG